MDGVWQAILQFGCLCLSTSLFISNDIFYIYKLYDTRHMNLKLRFSSDNIIVNWYILVPFSWAIGIFFLQSFVEWCKILMLSNSLFLFLAALAALYLTCPSSSSVTATLEFWHKEWLLRLETLPTIDRGDELRKRLKFLPTFFLTPSPWSNVWRGSSLKSHSLCQNSKVAPTTKTPRSGIELPGQLKTSLESG